MVHASINVNSNSNGQDVMCHDSFGSFRAIKSSDNGDNPSV